MPVSVTIVKYAKFTKQQLLLFLFYLTKLSPFADVP